MRLVLLLGVLMLALLGNVQGQYKALDYVHYASGIPAQGTYVGNPPTGRFELIRSLSIELLVTYRTLSDTLGFIYYSRGIRDFVNYSFYAAGSFDSSFRYLQSVKGIHNGLVGKLGSKVAVVGGSEVYSSVYAIQPDTGVYWHILTYGLDGKRLNFHQQLNIFRTGLVFSTNDRNLLII